MHRSEKLKSAAEWYANNPYARALVSTVTSLVPGAGGVDTLLGTAGAAIAEQRRDKLIDQLHELFSRLDADKLDKNFLQSEAWGDLLMQGIQNSARTRDTEKIRLFAAILAGAATVDRPADLDVEAVLGTLANLTPVEIGMAGHMYESVQREPHVFIDGCAPPDIPDADFHMKRLEAAGLVAARQPMGMVFQHIDTYHLTPTFYRIITALRNVGYKPGDPPVDSNGDQEGTDTSASEVNPDRG